MSQPAKEEYPTYAVVPDAERGGRPDSGGQSGDTQGLSSVAEAGSESVAELLEEGQAFEAEAVAQALCMETEDFTRAFRAFAAKQKPVFEGN